MLGNKKEQFVRLFASHERRLYAYILSLVPNWADADEIFQETNVRLWRDFEDFDQNTNFAAWSTKIAYFQILTWRKRVSRNRLIFDADTVHAVATSNSELQSLLEPRHRALGNCISELTGRSQDLLARSYAPGAKVDEVATSVGRSRDAVYKALQRIRSTLRACIERAMHGEVAN